MEQRYVVFLNDRTVTFCQNSNISDIKPGEIVLNFTNKASLAEAFTHFYRHPEYSNLIVTTNEKFTEACKCFNKMFTRIAAAGGIVRNQKGEFLFIKRLGIWDLPKGKLYKGEPVKNGALREVTEETGLSAITITKQLLSTFHIYTDRKGKEVLKETFWFEMKFTGDQQLVPQLEEDITEAKWFSQSEIYIPINNTYASLRSLLEKYCNL